MYCYKYLLLKNVLLRKRKQSYQKKYADYNVPGLLGHFFKIQYLLECYKSLLLKGLV